MSWIQSWYAKAFFESQVPGIIKQLTRIADALEEQNERAKQEAITEDPSPSIIRKLRKEEEEKEC